LRTRTSLTGEVIVEVVPPHKDTPNSYTGTVGALPISVTAELLTDQRLYTDDTAISTRIEKFLALFLPVLVLSFLIIHFAPKLFLWVSIADLFLAGLMLSSARVIPSFDDAYTDVGISLAVALFFGPLIALIAFVVIGLVKQEMNGAVITLLLTFFVVRYLTAFVFQSVTDVGMRLSMFVAFAVTNTLALLLTFAGWICGSFFRPLDEV